MNINPNVHISSRCICMVFLALMAVTLFSMPTHAQRPSIAGLEQQILDLQGEMTAKTHTYTVVTGQIVIPIDTGATILVLCDEGDVVLGGQSFNGEVVSGDRSLFSWGSQSVLVDGIEREAYFNHYTLPSLGADLSTQARAHCMDTTPGVPDRPLPFVAECEDISTVPGLAEYVCNTLPIS